jgi:hypothetical protein
MTLALAACVASLPAIPAVFSWGGSAPSVVTLRADDEALAVVEFVNTLTFGPPREPFDLALGDLTVTINIQIGPGSEPEVVTVTVPEQYVVVPPVLVVDDYTTGIQRIYCADALPLG